MKSSEEKNEKGSGINVLENIRSEWHCTEMDQSMK